MSEILKSVLGEKEPKTGTMITLRMPEELLSRLNAVCANPKVNKPRARIIKAMIEAGLAEMESALLKLEEIERYNEGAELLLKEVDKAVSEGWASWDNKTVEEEIKNE